MGCSRRSVADAALRAPGEPSRSLLPSLSSPISPPRCEDRPTCADISLWAAVWGFAAVTNAAVCGSAHDCRRCRWARRDGGITWIERRRTQRERVGPGLAAAPQPRIATPALVGPALVGLARLGPRGGEGIAGLDLSGSGLGALPSG